MRTLLPLIATSVFISSVEVTQLHADDNVALQYAQEAHAAMKTDMDRMQRMYGHGLVPHSKLSAQRELLLQSEITLLSLQGDDDGVGQLLQKIVALKSDDHRRHQELAKQGTFGASKLWDSELHILIAKLELAQHREALEEVEQVLQQAFEIEQNRLQMIEQLVDKGVVSQAELGKQKLRIARMMATRRIKPVETEDS